MAKDVSFLVDALQTARPSELVALAAIGCAVVQLLASSWRDLVVLPVAAAGISVGMHGFDSGFWATPLLVLAAAVSAIALIRAGRNGVGRPGIAGAAWLLAVVCGALPWLSAWLEPESLRSTGRVVFSVTTVAGVLGAGLAMVRPGPWRARPTWHRRVPIREDQPV